MAMPLHPYHFNQKVYTYTKLKLTAAGNGKIEFTASFPKRSSIALLSQPISYNLRVYGVNHTSIFEVENHIFQLSNKHQIQEIRDEKKYAYYAYRIALKKLMDLPIPNTTVRATIAHLITQVKAIESKYPYDFLNGVLRSTYNLLSSPNPTQYRLALKEYQQTIDKVNQEGKYKNIGIIMMILSFVLTAISLAIIFPPAIPAGLALAGKISLALPPPLFIGGAAFFSNGCKVQKAAQTMNSLLSYGVDNQAKISEETSDNIIFN